MNYGEQRPVFVPVAHIGGLDFRVDYKLKNAPEAPDSTSISLAFARWVKDYLNGGGNVIMAIKLVRAVRGMGLKEAKDMVEQIRDTYIPAPTY